MSLIKNLIQEKVEKTPTEDDEAEKPEKSRPIVKSAYDLQRLKLEKLMKNPDKLVEIPEHKSENDYMKSVPTFVRNVMGSSAGAGSGEFHVYRHLRRKEFARQKMIEAKSTREQMNDEYQKKIEENRRIAEEKTAKKRAKRLKKKKFKKVRKNNDKNSKQETNATDPDESSEESDEEDTQKEPSKEDTSDNEDSTKDNIETSVNEESTKAPQTNEEPKKDTEGQVEQSTEDSLENKSVEENCDNEDNS